MLNTELMLNTANLVENIVDAISIMNLRYCIIKYI